MTFTLIELEESSEGTGKGRAGRIQGRCFKSKSRHILKRTTSSCHLSLDRACYRYKQNMTKTTLIQREQKLKNKQLVAEVNVAKSTEILKHVLKPGRNPRYYTIYISRY